MKVIVMEEMSKLKMSKDEPLDLSFKPINLKAYHEIEGHYIQMQISKVFD